MTLHVRPTKKDFGVYLTIGMNRATVIYEGTKDECYHIHSHIRPIKENTTINFAMFDVVEPKLKNRTIDIDHFDEYDLSVIYFLDSITGERHLSYIWNELEHTLYGFKPL